MLPLDLYKNFQYSILNDNHLCISLSDTVQLFSRYFQLFGIISPLETEMKTGHAHRSES